MPIPPPELIQYMESFELPPGRSLKEYLGRFDEVQNGDPPTIGEYLQGIPISTVAGWRVTADVAVPDSRQPHPVLLWFHGGGWTVGNPWSHRRLAQEFAHRGFLTVSVDYRRAPKHPFPAAVEDCQTALSWTLAEIGGFGGDPARVAVGGDSAGGNLAAAAAVSAADSAAIRAAVLLYGIFDYHRALQTIPSFARIVGGASAGEQLYVAEAEFAGLAGDPRLSPERACRRFPPTHVSVGSRDPLYPESLALAECLRSSGVELDLFVAEGAPHSFFQLPGLDCYELGYRRATSFLQKHLS